MAALFPFGDGAMTTERPEILFLCVHNAGRSQIAAAFARVIGGDRIVVRSAGSEPSDEIHLNVAIAMRELGIDLTDASPRVLTDDDARTADVVITMGCGDACPVYPGKRYVDWQIDDPAGRPLDEVRRIRGLIRLKVEGLLRELGVTSG